MERHGDSGDSGDSSRPSRRRKKMNGETSEISGRASGEQAKRTSQERGIESHGVLSLKRVGAVIRSPGPEQ